ncbi:hypothetical protein CCY99_01885 [Helicobacter sp. 16-1353]|nr:DUF262 domain-containing protein [Helicobacter sp. 16-1353]RAX54917.1 hypothetical protein CCY99_01885 [Helicobacter sp. 16-1353]
MAQKKISEIFGVNWLSIPQYQRDYAWGEKNFRDLWEDLRS